MAIILFQIASTVVTILYYLIFAHIILSWIRNMNPTLSQIAETVDQLVNPILRPLRNIVPKIDLGGAQLDLTAIVALLLLSFIRAFVLPVILALPF